MTLYDPELEVGSKLERVLITVGSERRRQDILKAQGRFTHTAADPEVNDYERLAFLAEEFGEVAKEILSMPGGRRIAHDYEGTKTALRKELVQVAAICVAWIEGMS